MHTKYHIFSIVPFNLFFDAKRQTENKSSNTAIEIIIARFFDLKEAERGDWEQILVPDAETSAYWLN